MNRILVIAEKDAKNLTAFHRALALAKNTETEIDLVGFVHAPGVDSSDLLTETEKKRVRQKLIDEKTQWMKAQLEKIDYSHIKLDWGVLWEKSVHLWAIERCKQKPYDLVIKTGHRSESLTYTPTDWHLIRQCAAPVMIVSSKKWKSNQCILAAVDLNTETNNKIKLNKLVIEQAQQLANITGQQVVYLYCFTLPRLIDDLDIIDESKLFKKAKQNALDHLDKYYKKFNIDKESVHIVRGSVSKAINKTAHKLAADLVVLGTLGRKGIKGKLIGNTAEEVLHDLKTDVLAVKL
jgi:universal stress protein E